MKWHFWDGIQPNLFAYHENSAGIFVRCFCNIPLPFNLFAELKSNFLCMA